MDAVRRTPTHLIACIPQVLTAVALAACACQLAAGWAWSNDAWFLLAVGEHVLGNGPAHDAWFSPFGGQTVEQQWLYAALLAVLYRAFGCAGPTCLAAALWLASCALAALLARRLGASRPGPVRLMLFLTACLLLSEGGEGVMGIRPSSASAVLWLAAAHLGVSAGRARTAPHRALAAFFLAALTALHVSVHASMVLFDLVVFAAFFSEASLPACGTRRTLALLAAFLAAGAAGSLLGPYGWKGALYMPLSLSAAKAVAVGTEMGSLLSKPSGAAAALALYCAVAVLVAVLWLRRCRRFAAVPLLLLLSAAMTAAASRCVNVEALFLVLAALLCPPPAPRSAPGRFSRARSLAAGALSSTAVAFPIIVAACCATYISASGGFAAGAQLDSCAEAAGARAAMAEAGARPGDSVLTDSVTAGVLEFSGYRVSYDARPELYAPVFTDLSEDWNAAWCSFSYDGADPDGYISRCGCDWVLLRVGSVSVPPDALVGAAEAAGYSLLGTYDAEGAFPGYVLFSREGGR